MSAQKRKRTDFTLKEKKEIIDAAKKESNQSKLAREISKKWGVKVKRTTVKGILSKKDAIEAAIKAGVPSKRMKLPFEEAQRAWSTVRKFMQQRSGKPGVMQACDQLDNEMLEIRRKKMRQRALD